MRKPTGAVLVAMLAMCSLTCKGGGESNSITNPTACTAELAGEWTWTVVPPCGTGFAGISTATFDAATCTMTMDVVTEELRARGISQILRMNFSTMRATVTQNAEPCSSTDQGQIIRDPNSYRIVLQRAANGNCCAGSWGINIIR